MELILAGCVLAKELTEVQLLPYNEKRDMREKESVGLWKGVDPR